MKHLIVRILNFFGILCGIKPEAVVVRGPNGKTYRVEDAKIDDHGLIFVTVVPATEAGMCLESIEHVKSGPLDWSVLNCPADSNVRAKS